MLIVSEVPLVAWGIQSSLIGLPGVEVKLGGSQEEAEGAQPGVVVVAPAAAPVGLCRKVATWRRGGRSSQVVCLAPGSSGGPCPQVDVVAPLDDTGPAELRQMLRRAIGQVQNKRAAEERALLPGDYQPPQAGEKPVRVSAREREVGMLVAEGCSSGEIAERLFISQRTVEKHRANLMTKLGVTNAAALTRELLYLCWTEGSEWD